MTKTEEKILRRSLDCLFDIHDCIKELVKKNPILEDSETFYDTLSELDEMACRILNISPSSKTGEWIGESFYFVGEKVDKTIMTRTNLINEYLKLYEEKTK